MRTLARAGGLAAVLLTTVFAGGCLVEDAGVRPQRLSAVTAAPKKRHKVKAVHLVKALPTVTPGNRMRQFCDQRHIQFQAGTLDEKPDELAANNQLCRQIYEKGALGPPTAATATDDPK